MDAIPGGIRPRPHRSVDAVPCSYRPRSASRLRSCRPLKQRPSSTSASRSRACRWRFNSRPRGHACCPARRSRPSFDREPKCCKPSTLHSRHAMPASRWYSTTHGGCSHLSSVRRCRGFRCFAAALRRKPHAQWRVLRCPLSRHSRTNHFFAKIRRAFSCIRFCINSRRSGSKAVTATPPGAQATTFTVLVQLRRGIENGDSSALNQIDADFENCRSAGAGRTRHEEPFAGESVQSVMHYCDHRGLVREGLALIQDALESPVGKDAKLEASLLATLSHFEYRLDRYVDARTIAERALASARGVDDHEARIQSLKTLGTSSLRLGRYDEAKGHLRTALQQSSSKTDRRNAAAMLSTMGSSRRCRANRTTRCGSRSRRRSRPA